MKQDLIWEHFQTDGVSSFEGSAGRMRFLVRRLRAGERVLNIGVGAGYLEEFAAKKGVKIYALDPSSKAIEGLRNRLQLGERAVISDATYIPFQDSTFDAVVMSEVMEHLEENTLNTALNEVARILKVKGRLLVTVPHEEVLDAGSVICPCCGEKFHRWGHVRSFSKATLVPTLVCHGFQIKNLKVQVFPDWRRPGYTNLMKSVARVFAAKFRLGIASPSIFCEAMKDL